MHSYFEQDAIFFSTRMLLVNMCVRGHVCQKFYFELKMLSTEVFFRLELSCILLSLCVCVYVCVCVCVCVCVHACMHACI